MCDVCYNGMDLEFKINQIKQFDNVNVSDFIKWNSVSIGYLYLMYIDPELHEYKYIIENVYKLIKNNKKKILDDIGYDSDLKQVYLIYDILEKAINEK